MIGNNIAALRKIRGLTQVDLAMAIHVTQSAVSQWETGKTVPDLQQLYILSNFFGVSVDALTSEKGIIPTGTQKASPEPQKIDPHTYYAQKFGRTGLDANRSTQRSDNAHCTVCADSAKLSCIAHTSCKINALRITRNMRVYQNRSKRKLRRS